MPAELELARPKELAAVPSSAVITGPEGKTCVLVPHGSRFLAYFSPTEPGLPGMTELTELPTSVQNVLTNPAQVFPARGCG